MAESDGYLYTAGGGPAVAMCHPAPAPPDVDSGVDKCYVNVRHFSISCHTQLQLHYSTSVCFYIYSSSNLYREVQLDVMTDDLSAF